MKAEEDIMNRISFALKDPVLQMGFEVICSKLARLEKENAELKEQCLLLADCNTCHSTCKNKNVEIKKQLIKAKEIIKYLCGMVRELNKPNVQLTDVDYSLSEAEQFLRESE